MTFIFEDGHFPSLFVDSSVDPCLKVCMLLSLYAFSVINLIYHSEIIYTPVDIKNMFFE